MRKISMTAVAMTVGLTSGAWAQSMPVYESTGTLELLIEGKPATYHTTSNTVPNQPERRVNTAWWKVFEPMMLGGVNLAPPGVFVSLVSRPTVEPDVSSPELKITFSLDESDYTLLESAPVEVLYTVREGPLTGEYEYASGVLQIQSATPVGEKIMKITGMAAGTLKVRGKGKKGSERVLNYEADFSVDAYHQ